MKRRLALFLSLTMLAGLFTGCASQPKPADVEQPAQTTPQENSVAPTSFHYAFLDEPPGIDPSISQGNTQSTIYGALYEGLVTSDENGNVVPGAAESWTTNDDKTEYVFTLRDGLKWSDGQPVTAGDFEYSWKRVLNPETASTYSWFVEMFLLNGAKYTGGEVSIDEVGVKAVDDKTLEVKLENPSSFFLQALLQGCWCPVRKDMVEKDPEKWCFNAETAVSNGPFKLKEYKIGSYISMEKNENYWDAASVSIQDVKFSFIKDANTALSAFKAGEVDGIAGVPAAEYINLMTSDNRLYTYDRLAFNFLRLNTKNEALSNVKVRQAISLAFSRKDYLDGLGNITAVPALGTVPAGLVLDGKDFREVSGNNNLEETAQVEKAQALLAEAGYPNGEGMPTLGIYSTESGLKGAEIVQQMLLDNLGIKSEIHPVDDKLYFPLMVDGKYDIAFGGWGGDYTHPMTFLSLFTSTAYDNCTGWANEEYDKLIDEAQKESDEAKALDLMVNAEHILVEESPIVPISFPAGSIMIQDYVKGWFISASDVLYFTRATINK